MTVQIKYYLSAILSFVGLVLSQFSRQRDPVPLVILSLGLVIAFAASVLLVVEEEPEKNYITLPGREPLNMKILLSSMLLYSALFMLIGLFSGLIKPSSVIFIDNSLWYYIELWMILLYNGLIGIWDLWNEIPPVVNEELKAYS